MKSRTAPLKTFKRAIFTAILCACAFHNLRAGDAAGRGDSDNECGVVGYAVWYRVPIHSLAHRRAKEGEFTAAHNRLPLGTIVRVTRLANDESVLVRITDRGITNRRAKIDICKEAAEKLGMIREGFSRVRMEIIPEAAAANAPDTGSVAAH